MTLSRESTYPTAGNDAFHTQDLSVRFSQKEVQILLAFLSYMHQVQPLYTLSFGKRTLLAYPPISTLLLQLFKTRFEGKALSLDASSKILLLNSELTELIEAISQSLEKIFFYQLKEVILHIVRTNIFKNPTPSVLSFKIESSLLSFLPPPKPWREIFVYAPHVEGIHLRGGPIARGGIRFSERIEDYRTEILGLFKTQLSKNAIIIPTGAKGGFIAKNLPSPQNRSAFSQEILRCYKDFITALLELTDNVIQTKVVSPSDILIYDGEDPYLVVAADKGTASFSDIANEISKAFSFWLGDAFASGGTHGYDHKALGITARGAWSAVKRHLWEADIPFSPLRIIGIGSMAGDVFGNGMLQSENIQLVGAFTGKYIFLDPHPDPKSSFEERKRLFHLPNSSWADYDPHKISKGGGVFPRALSSISLSPEIQKLLDVSDAHLSPDALLQRLLKSPVDLLWFGGIGTFVKASTETHTDAQDPQNDAIRIDACELKAQVIGEGANLGLTYKARLQYALQGGRLNADAIDNAAGVDCSDHEVNIKIFLHSLEKKGKISEDQRNHLLKEMTEDVVSKVLGHTKNQTLAISLSQYGGGEEHRALSRWCKKLSQEGWIEETSPLFLLSRTSMEEKEWTRPELSLLLAHTMLFLKQSFLQSPTIQTELFPTLLEAYFPVALIHLGKEGLHHHPLRKEILSLQLSTFILTQVGLSFMGRMMETTSRSAPEIAHVFFLLSQSLHLEELKNRILDIQPHLAPSIFYPLYRRISHFYENIIPLVFSLFRSITQGPFFFFSHLQDQLGTLLSQEQNLHLQQEALLLENSGVPPSLAKEVINLQALLLLYPLHFKSLDLK